MCMTCGCMDAHKEMGENMTFEDLDRIATGNDKSVDRTLEIIAQTAAIDRAEHESEYTASAGRPLTASQGG